MKKSDIHKNFVQQILKANGPLLGSELGRLLTQRHGINSNYTRRIIHTLKSNKEILSTDPVRFQKNQVLYFLPGQGLKTKENASEFTEIKQVLKEFFKQTNA